jgi:ABC-type antimicrobial peptide transport system permease subunit
MSFVIDTSLQAAAVKSAAERAVRELDRNIPVDNFQAMDDLLGNYLAGRKVTVLALSAFAGIAIVLAIMGIYGLVANDTINRRRELAIRLALGATSGQLLFVVLRRGLFAALGGVMLAIALVASFARIIASLLFDVAPVDPSIYFVTALSIVLVTAVAALVPAKGLFQLAPAEILKG